MLQLMNQRHPRNQEVDLCCLCYVDLSSATSVSRNTWENNSEFIALTLLFFILINY